LNSPKKLVTIALPIQEFVFHFFIQRLIVRAHACSIENTIDNKIFFGIFMKLFGRKKRYLKGKTELSLDFESRQFENSLESSLTRSKLG